MHHQPARLPQSADTPRSPHGRCALCLTPIYETQEAQHVPTIPQRYATDVTVKPIPYQHKECPR